jgi:hypothetical protein
MPVRRRLRAVTLVALAYLGACSLGVSSEDDYFAVDENSCVGFCGSESPVPGSSPECFCDEACVDSGDCCKDAIAVCGLDGGSSGDAPAGSCACLCGSPDPAGECFCDDACVDNGDCCPDYAQLCTPDASG